MRFLLNHEVERSFLCGRSMNGSSIGKQLRH